MDSSRKSNKIREIVKLQQILKKWKKLANNNRSSNASGTTTTSSSSGSKSIKFLKKTLSFSESTSSPLACSGVPKGYVAVCVGRESKRFVIPMDYLSHQAFGILLREAEEEFGFQQEGVLKFPCEVEMFEKILKIMEDKKSSSAAEVYFFHDDQDDFMTAYGDNYSSDHCELTPSHHHPQMCR